MTSVKSEYGVAIVIALAVVALAAVLLTAGAGPSGSGAASSGTFASPPVLTGSAIPEQYRIQPGGTVTFETLEPYATGPTPESPGPEPTDFPFGGNTPIWTNSLSQTKPTMALDSTGRVYVAFQHAASVSNDDIYVAWSDNNGVSWSTPVGAATTGANERNPSMIITTGDRITIFIQQDGNPTAFAYVQSIDRGLTWTPTTVGFGATPIEDLQFPSFVGSGTAAYGLYQVWCTESTTCAPGAWSAINLFNTDVSVATGWTGLYFTQTPDVELFHPVASWNSAGGYGVGALEIEIFDNTAWDVTWFRFTPPTSFTQDGLMCGTFCPSSEFVWPAVTADGNRALAGAHFNNGAIAPNVIILAVYSLNTPGGGPTWDLVNSNTGTIDASAQDQRYLSFDLEGTQVTSTYWKASAIWHVSSLNTGVTFDPTPERVSDNMPPTAIQAEHATVVENSTIGPLVAWHDSRDGNPNIYFAAFQRFSVTVDTFPANLRVRIDAGAFQNAPLVASLPAGSVHTIQAESPQSPAAGTQYVFQAWNDSSTTNPKTITVTGDIIWTASFLTQYQITVASNPTGREVIVNGGTRTAPYQFWCNASEVANLNAPSPQSTGPTTRYRFDSWSDGLPQAHPITCNAPTTVTANFVLQYLVTIRTSPVNLNITVDGVTYTAPAPFWFDQNSGHALFAISPQATGPNSQYVFTDWTGGPGVQAWNVAITGSTDYIANYRLQYRVVLDTNPTGLDLTVDGVPATAPAAFFWDAGSSHNAIAITPQFAGTTTRYVFSAWSDGNPAASRSILADQPKTVIAVYTTEYFLTMNTNFGTVSPGNGWHPAGDVVGITATAPAGGAQDRYTFDQWTGDYTGTTPTGTVTMDAPKSVTANWFHEFRVEITSNVPSLTVDIDGTPGVTLPAVRWWADGSAHTVTAQAQVTIGADERWNFATWTGGSTNPALSVPSVSGPASYAASYSRQFLVTIITSPSGRTVTVDGVPYTAPVWVDENAQIVLEAATPQQGAAGTRYVFTNWDGGSTTQPRQYSVTAAATLTATFQTQYQLTVDSQYGNPQCLNADDSPCWYDAGSVAQAQITSPFPSGGTTWTFTGWSDDATGTGPTASITMDGPRTATAGWREVTFLESYGVLLGILIAVIAAIVIALLLLMRRRKKEEPEAAPPMREAPAARAPPPPPSAAPATGGTKACAACGMEIPASAATCPVCGSPT